MKKRFQCNIWPLQVPSEDLIKTQTVFQLFINDVLKDMLGKYVVSYIDDILVYSPSLSIHVDHVHQVLQRKLTCYTRPPSLSWDTVLV